ncbi:hypothetical protein TSUD_78380 [Trifolium subterraneum]|uniref:Large ribosomal subunit protein uL6 N-terminal domain-containing protein n=1 Tax=Trifolium subterraneum TaxID=3900 RepID=A0A2Z6MC47_TRISU|nr:hypothetical protein TSUD_78380 [Trifolium subterraneum]
MAPKQRTPRVTRNPDLIRGIGKFSKSQMYHKRGPFKINGVPLRRVNQAYVIGTSTKVDISGVNVDNFDDKYFSKEAQKKKSKGEGEFFESDKEEKKVLPQQKKDDQKTVDAALIKSIESVPDLKTYLGARFSLKADSDTFLTLFKSLVLIGNGILLEIFLPAFLLL